ncbi:hypothetical protein HYU13_06640 [Candidatus Woesearchaeota archaeon]|nr:hypothetical protein [Candidatus Woesearchaeota archaeon]
MLGKMKMRFLLDSLLITALLLLIIVSGCAKQAPRDTLPDQASTIAADEGAQCEEKWMCKNEFTKALRTSSCSFEQESPCPSGCIEGGCVPGSSVSVPGTKPQEAPQAGLDSPTEEKNSAVEKDGSSKSSPSCTPVWTCLDKKRIGYQLSSCKFTKVDECPFGCEGGRCSTTAPPKETVAQEHIVLADGSKAIGLLGNTYIDFSQKKIFLLDVPEHDVKIYLYSDTQGYPFIKALSPASTIWTVDKSIEGIIFEDCKPSNDKLSSYADLISGQTLCVVTVEKNIAAMGGTWLGAPNTKTVLSWKLFS